MDNVTGPARDDTVMYARFVTISGGASGVVVGAAAGSFGVLTQSPWPLILLVAYVAFQIAIAIRFHPHLRGLRRRWTFPILALVTGVLASTTPRDAAPFVLGAAMAGYIVWIVAYGVLDTHFDPSGKHGAGWL